MYATRKGGTAVGDTGLTGGLEEKTLRHAFPTPNGVERRDRNSSHPTGATTVFPRVHTYKHTYFLCGFLVIFVLCQDLAATSCFVHCLSA